MSHAAMSKAKGASSQALDEKGDMIAGYTVSRRRGRVLVPVV